MMKSYLNRILIVSFLATLALSQLPPQGSVAQSSDLTWDEPVNVSQTGGTTQPVLAIDPSDNLYAFWNDIYADQGFSQWDGQTWTAATPAIFNFGTVTPQFFNDDAGDLHAFWIDALGVLAYSRVSGTTVGNPASWTSSLSLATDVLAFSASVGNNGRIYVAYIVGLSSGQTPPGIYLRSYNPTNAGWGAVTPIYQSQYYRGLIVDNAHVNVSVSLGASQDSVFVAWDDTSLNRVMLIKSPDEGETWGDPIEVAGPKPGETPSGPFNIQTFSYKTNLLVLWQSGLQSSFDCTQNYLFSDDLGESMQSPSIMLDSLVGCPQSIKLFQGPDDLIFMMAKVQETNYLVAWNDSTWSSPQSQQILSSFTDPLSHKLVKLDFLKPVVNSQFKLFVIGSDTVGNGDTWVLQRELGSKEDWFPPVSSWTKTRVIYTSETPIDSIRVVADQNGVFHALWRESTNPDGLHRVDKIFYASYSGMAWSDPVEIVKSPDQKIGELSAISSADDNLYLVWNGETLGEVYLAWANTRNSTSPFEWAKPITIPINGMTASASISIGVTGELNIVYAVPVNEARGIYFVQSADQGKTWSEPRTVFNATENNWEMVGQPHLAQSGDVVYHAIWTKNSSLGNGYAIGLYYSSTADDGLTWSKPQEITDQGITNSWLNNYQSAILHRLWVGEKNIDNGIWHESSTDNGNKWVRSAPISIADDVGGTTVTFDLAGHIHTFQSFQTERQQPMVNHLWWNGDQWVSENNLAYSSTTDPNSIELATAVNKDGIIMLVGRTLNTDVMTNLPVQELAFSSRVFDQAVIEVILPPQTPQPGVDTIPLLTQELPTPGATITATGAVPNFSQGSAEFRPGNATMTIIVGAFAAVVVILATFILFKRLR